MESTADNATIARPQNMSWGVRLLLKLIALYSYALSPFLGMHCRFHPTCSMYAQQAFGIHGFWTGLRLTLLRLSRCHPWHVGGADPVPDSVRPIQTLS